MRKLSLALDAHRADHESFGLAVNLVSAGDVYDALSAWADCNGYGIQLDRALSAVASEVRSDMPRARAATIRIRAARQLGYWFASYIYQPVPVLTPDLILGRVDQAPLLWALSRVYLGRVGGAA